MTSIAPPPLSPDSSTKTNIGVLKALLITVAIVGVLGFIGYQFVQGREEAKEIRRQTDEDVKMADEAIKHAREARAVCEKDPTKC